MSAWTSPTHPPAQPDIDSWETEGTSPFILKVDPPAPKNKKKKKKKIRAGGALDQGSSKWHPSHVTTGVPAGYYELDDIDCRDMGFIRSKKTEVPQSEDPWPELDQQQTPEDQQEPTSGLESSVTAVVNEDSSHEELLSEYAATAAPDMTRLLLEENHRLKADLARACWDLQEQAVMFGEEKHHILMEIRTLQEDLHQAKEGQEALRKQLEEERFSLQAKHQEVTSSLEATLLQARTDLQGMKDEWQREKSDLLKQAEAQLERERQQQEETSVLLLKQKETIRSLSAEHEKVSTMEDALSQALKHQQEMETRWEVEKSNLLSEHQKVTSKLQQELAKAKQDLSHQKGQWEEERTALLEDKLQQQQEAKQELEKQELERTIPTSRQTLDEEEEQSAECSNTHIESLSSTEGPRAGAQRKTNRFIKWFQRAREAFRRKTSAED